MARVHYCSQLCGVCSLSRLMWAPTLSAPIITIYSACFSFMRIENGSSRSRHRESSFSAFPWPISKGNFSRCRCKLLLIVLNHSQMVPHHNHASEWKTIVKNKTKKTLTISRQKLGVHLSVYFIFLSLRCPWCGKKIITLAPVRCRAS